MFYCEILFIFKIIEMPGLPLLGSVLSIVSLFHEEFVSYNGTHLIFKVMFYIS